MLDIDLRSITGSDSDSNI